MSIHFLLDIRNTGRRILSLCNMCANISLL